MNIRKASKHIKENKITKLGIYGGTFNPPHKSHKQIVTELLNKNYVDKIIIVPTGNNYQKPEIINFHHRYNMLKILFQNQNIEISKYENKSKQIYTYQTLNHYTKKYPNANIYFITGEDNLQNLKTWKNYNHIINNYKVIAIKRKGYKSKKQKNIIYAPIDVPPISSSQIRKQKDYKNVDKKVKEYIKANNLY